MTAEGVAREAEVVADALVLVVSVGLPDERLLVGANVVLGVRELERLDDAVDEVDAVTARVADCRFLRSRTSPRRFAAENQVSFTFSFCYFFLANSIT